MAHETGVVGWNQVLVEVGSACEQLHSLLCRYLLFDIYVAERVVAAQTISVLPFVPWQFTRIETPVMDQR